MLGKALRVKQFSGGGWCPVRRWNEASGSGGPFNPQQRLVAVTWRERASPRSWNKISPYSETFGRGLNMSLDGGNNRRNERLDDSCRPVQAHQKKEPFRDALKQNC
jgi:hypothetical protein